jgi:polyketide biosynthesis enoyl-CoA hydratase PksI
MDKSVVKLTSIETEIVLITMEDRDYKNTFSQALITGLIDAFDKIKNMNEVKVVILTGYDSYFSLGGTQEELMLLQQGKMKFTDINVNLLPLQCDVPVISAMQGHGIGGGLVLGLFSDFVIMSRESIYSANFMKYGFTPGMGATYIIPKKIGLAFGHEMLINAQTYRGEELKERGIPFPVVPRTMVLEKAYELALQLKEKPRLSLAVLKNHLTASIKNELSKIIEQEVVMHDKTFHQEIVKEKIQNMFRN